MNHLSGLKPDPGDGLGPYHELSLGGGSAVRVSPESLPLVAGVGWRLAKSRSDRPGRPKWYAAGTGKNRHRLMHRHVMNAVGNTKLVDHVNGDGLDNRLANLRFATPSENMWNRQPNAGREFKGVSPARGGKWRAQIRHNGAQTRLGTFSTRDEAARAYDAKARELFGEFARLNFPLQQGGDGAQEG